MQNAQKLFDIMIQKPKFTPVAERDALWTFLNAHVAEWIAIGSHDAVDNGICVSVFETMAEMVRLNNFCKHNVLFKLPLMELVRLATRPSLDSIVRQSVLGIISEASDQGRNKSVIRAMAQHAQDAAAFGTLWSIGVLKHEDLTNIVAHRLTTPLIVQDVLYAA